MGPTAGEKVSAYRQFQDGLVADPPYLHGVGAQASLRQTEGLSRAIGQVYRKRDATVRGVPPGVPRSAIRRRWYTIAKMLSPRTSPRYPHGGIDAGLGRRHPTIVSYREGGSIIKIEPTRLTAHMS